MTTSRSVRRSVRELTHRVLNCLDSPDKEKDWTVDDARAAGMLEGDGMPREIDLRQSWWDVGDQGSTGSCVGWAAADSVIRWHFHGADRLRDREKLSVRYLWMASKETDEFQSRPTTFIERDGTSLKSALNIARKYGMVKERDLRFRGGLYQGTATAFYAIASQMKIGSFFNLGTDPANWRAWLAFNGPVLTRLDIDDAWDALDVDGSDGRLTTYRKPPEPRGHAVALVGYRSDGSFIVRNSWGTGWGDGGFAYASTRYARAAFTEAYGVRL
jgi:C1A family cysteine protease